MIGNVLSIEPGNTFPDIMSFENARERYVRAEVLLAARDTVGALRWFATFPHPSSYDAWFMGGALVKRAELEAALHEDARAAQDYARFAELWHDSDPAMQPMVVQASTRARAR
jgi:hypothetical protein